MLDLNLCWKCEAKLERSARKRVSPCMCKTCASSTDRTSRDRTGADPLKQLWRDIKKAAKPLTPEEQSMWRSAWKSQELKLDDNDKVIINSSSPSYKDVVLAANHFLIR